MEYVSVTRSISLLRNKDLPYSHHREVAKLEPEESIAKEFGIDIATVSRIIKSLQNGEIAKMQKDFTPLLYNIWNIESGRRLPDLSFSHHVEVASLPPGLLL